MGPGAALGIGGGRHAERLVARLIDATGRTIARAIERIGHRLALAQRLAETLALARHQPVARIDAQLSDETLAERTARQADPARHLGERGRCIGVGRIEQGAGLGDGLAEAEIGPRSLVPVARLAALAGPEPCRLGRLGRGMEAHVAAQRRARRTGRQAIDPGRLDREPEPAVVRPVTPLYGLPAGFPVRQRVGKEWRGESQGRKGKRMLGHSAIKAPWANLLYPASAGNFYPER